MKEEILRQLQTTWAGRNLYYFSEIDSTNTYAKQLGKQSEPHGTIVVAQSQSAGRGRLGRKWNSPNDGNIYMTILLRPKFSPQKASMLTLVMAYSVAMSIREFVDTSVYIKWPNDIVMNGKKICGILTEMSAEVDDINYVVIGIGVNVMSHEFPDALQDIASSILIESGQNISETAHISSIMRNFEQAYQRFCETEDMSNIYQEYNQMLINRNRQVRILDGENGYEAYAMGIDKMGQLLIRKQDGSVEAVFAGEVSVRGLYGYVE